MRLLPSLLALVVLHAGAIAAFTYRDLSAKACRERNAASPADSAVEFPSEDPPPSLPSVLWSPRRNARGIFFGRRYRCLVLRAGVAGGGDGAGAGKKKGYKFGDFTKSLIGGSVEKVRDVHVLNFN